MSDSQTRAQRHEKNKHPDNHDGLVTNEQKITGRVKEINCRPSAVGRASRLLTVLLAGVDAVVALVGALDGAAVRGGLVEVVVALLRAAIARVLAAMAA